ncbi:hypothetical protein NESM_000117200 [Novymonas esmeraldas]|uniref:Uncharacterized protein n=1 Tax=Novymonas esmeraldas TaxID=1808958 RepID=A0AAW0F451_9TRYP
MNAHGNEAVAECIAANHPSGVVWAWCAASPAFFSAAIRASARVVRTAAGERAHYLPRHSDSEGCVCAVRVDRAGIVLNDFTRRVPAWLVTWHVKLLYRLFGADRVAVHITDPDSLVVGALLSSWEGTSITVAALTSRHRLGACVSAHRRRTGATFSALGGLRRLVLLPSQCETGSIAVAEHAPLLRRLTASACRVESLAPLGRLCHLHELDLAQTLIRDGELRILAALPRLATLTVSSCPHLSTLEPLAKAAALRVLRAAECERLVRVAALGTVATLQSVDLSGSVLLPAEFASFLSGPALRLRLGVFEHMRWPRDDPPLLQAAPVLSTATHLRLCYCVLPNLRWLCGARSVEQLFLDHTKVTAADVATLVPHMPFLSALSLSHCERLNTNLDFTHSMSLLASITISRSSLPAVFPELAALQLAMTVTVV